MGLIKDVLIFLLTIAVILWLLSAFGVIDLSGVYNWLYNLFYNY